MKVLKSKQRRDRRPDRKRGGFVLPVTVILLALVSVGVTLMARRSDQLRELAVATRQEQQAALSAQENLARAVFLSSTLMRSGSQLGSIQLDGRYYLGDDGAYVSYTDGGALYDLRRARPIEIQALLRVSGANDVQAATLADTLFDYLDADSLTRVNGAEAPEYAAAKQPPPRNGPLLMPSELQRIAGWKDLDPVVLRRFREYSYVGLINAVNRYTVKAPVLAAIGGSSLDVATQLVAARAPGMPVTIDSLPAVTRGNAFATARYLMVPSATLMISICPPAVAWCQHTSLTNTPDEGAGPWHLDYTFRQMRAEPLPLAPAIEKLPDKAPLRTLSPVISPFGFVPP